MINLNVKQKSFIEMMSRSPEHEREGFRILLERSDFNIYFDPLLEAGFFAADKNPSPVEASEKGYYSIPYWSALDYLTRLSQFAGETNDNNLVQKILSILRDVTANSTPENYHTFRKFAEMMSALPPSSVPIEDMNLIPLWIKGKFDRDTVGHVIGDKLLPRFANSSPENQEKALLILKYCTEIGWTEEEYSFGDVKDKKPYTFIDAHWLKELLKRSLPLLAKNKGKQASEILLERVREIFREEKRQKFHWMHRAAIEEHQQNHSFRETDNIFIDGMRDILLAWADYDATGVHQYIQSLFTTSDGIVKRICIYLISEKWDNLKDIFFSNIDVDLFEQENLHEFYNLLRKHFQSFPEDKKALVLQTIKQLPASSVEDPDKYLKHKQLRWLSALKGKGFTPVDELYAELASDPAAGFDTDHPDFLSYMEISSGQGPSPYEVEELLAFTRDKELIDKLNSFKEPEQGWRSTNIRSLVDALTEAVKLETALFLPHLDDFLLLKRPYQYGIINAFRQLWQSPEEKKILSNWDEIWHFLFDFFSKIISEDSFWTEKSDNASLTPSNKWIISIIPDFISDGTNDEHCFPPSLNNKAWDLVKVLLEKTSSPEVPPENDPMTWAINTDKGHVIQAMVRLALRICRVNDKENSSHMSVWNDMKPVFDKEISKCKNDNFSFSTLIASYVAHVEYLSEAWLSENFQAIFPVDHWDNFTCAVDGLAYTNGATRKIYNLLLQYKVIENVLTNEVKGDVAKEKILERMTLGYLWGLDKLDSERFSIVFSPDHLDDLNTVCNFLYNIHDDSFSAEHKKLVFDFIKRTYECTQSFASPPAKTLSELGQLIIYLDKIDPQDEKWLLAAAPYMNIHHRASWFVEELERLATSNLVATCKIFSSLLESWKPYYDYEGRILSLLKKLSHEESIRVHVIKIAETISTLDGVRDFYKEFINQ